MADLDKNTIKALESLKSLMASDTNNDKIIPIQLKKVKEKLDGLNTAQTAAYEKYDALFTERNRLYSNLTQSLIMEYYINKISVNTSQYIKTKKIEKILDISNTDSSLSKAINNGMLESVLSTNTENVRNNLTNVFNEMKTALNYNNIQINNGRIENTSRNIYRITNSEYFTGTIDFDSLKTTDESGNETYEFPSDIKYKKECYIGDGSESAPYNIESSEDTVRLRLFSSGSLYDSAYFTITTNKIDLSKYPATKVSDSTLILRNIKFRQPTTTFIIPGDKNFTNISFNGKIEYSGNDKPTLNFILKDFSDTNINIIFQETAQIKNFNINIYVYNFHDNRVVDFIAKYKLYTRFRGSVGYNGGDSNISNANINYNIYYNEMKSFLFPLVFSQPFDVKLVLETGISETILSEERFKQIYGINGNINNYSTAIALKDNDNASTTEENIETLKTLISAPPEKISLADYKNHNEDETLSGFTYDSINNNIVLYKSNLNTFKLDLTKKSAEILFYNEYSPYKDSFLLIRKVDGENTDDTLGKDPNDSNKDAEFQMDIDNCSNTGLGFLNALAIVILSKDPTRDDMQTMLSKLAEKTKSVISIFSEKSSSLAENSQKASTSVVYLSNYIAQNDSLYNSDYISDNLNSFSELDENLLLLTNNSEDIAELTDTLTENIQTSILQLKSKIDDVIRGCIFGILDLNPIIENYSLLLQENIEYNDALVESMKTLSIGISELKNNEEYLPINNFQGWNEYIAALNTLCYEGTPGTVQLFLAMRLGLNILSDASTNDNIQHCLTLLVNDELWRISTKQLTVSHKNSFGENGYLRHAVLNSNVQYQYLNVYPELSVLNNVDITNAAISEQEDPDLKAVLKKLTKNTYDIDNYNQYYVVPEDFKNLNNKSLIIKNSGYLPDSTVREINNLINIGFGENAEILDITSDAFYNFLLFRGDYASV